MRSRGLYAKVKAGTLKNCTGIDAPYWASDNPDLHQTTPGQSTDELADAVLRTLRAWKIIDISRS